MMGGWDWCRGVGVGDSGCGWGDKEWVFSHRFFYLCFCFLVPHVLSHFLSEQIMMAVVSVSLFVICFLSVSVLFVFFVSSPFN